MTNSAFIAGAWRAGAGEVFVSHDPASGDAVWEGAAATPDDVREAFAAARGAFADWALAGFEKRRAIAEAYGELVKSRQDEIGELIARETGKPLWEAKGEAGAMAAKIAVSIKAHDERAGRTRCA